MPIIYNTLKPELRLEKKCDANAYHAIHKSMAMKELLTGHVISEDNS